jgi:hypothetical protein
MLDDVGFDASDASYHLLTRSTAATLTCGAGATTTVQPGLHVDPPGDGADTTIHDAVSMDGISTDALLDFRKFRGAFTTLTRVGTRAFATAP